MPGCMALGMHSKQRGDYVPDSPNELPAALQALARPLTSSRILADRIALLMLPQCCMFYTLPSRC